MEIKIISEGNVRPASPTPPNLKTYKFSSLDQTHGPYYVQIITFFLNDLKTSLNDVISTRCKTLKHSLSQILSRFYPFAGKIKDDLYIDCNDEGVYYLEARVNYRLSKLLAEPNHDFLKQLAPEFPISLDKYVLGIQANVFDCGGIALTTVTSHKIFDVTSLSVFLNAWAAEARGSSLVQIPKFTATSLFPHNPSFVCKWPSIGNEAKFRTRRFLFDAVAIAAIKRSCSASSPFLEKYTTFEVVSGLVWKCATKAAIEAGINTTSTRYFVSISVNLRSKMMPRQPSVLIGNVFWYPMIGCVPEKDGLSLHHFVSKMKKVISSIDNDFIEEIKGEKGFSRISERIKEISDLKTKVDCLNFASSLNRGLYEVNFGWGKPVWFYVVPPNAKLVFFADTRSGDGVEVTATLREQDMAIFERDPEILAFTTMDPSPLELCNLVSRSRL